MKDIDHILSERGQAAMERTGLPGWADKDVFRHLSLDRYHGAGGRGNVLWILKDGTKEGGRLISDHEALCLIERHWRVWLEERDFVMECDSLPSEPKRYYWCMHSSTDLSGETENYIEALIAAILAAAILAAEK